MNLALSTALSGLMANARKIGVSANNVANMLTTGRLGAAPGSADAAYTPQQSSFKTTTGGGVNLNVTNADPATVPGFVPNDPNANADGMVAVPNVSLEQEIVDQKLAVIGYKANAGVIRAVEQMDKALFDIKT